MKRILIFAFILCAAGACSGKSKGWSQGDRDNLIGSCVEETKKTPGVDVSKLNGYCTCYQQILEKKYATLASLATESEAELTRLAEQCLSLIK